ncbi:ATP-binding protein [Thermus filiformis]|uniref:AAA+ ATPase domain-containing protein n=1 Tax=Thermus filiformis TaxID=276 RepID=A0A0A2XAQ9_THEFI|nr:AAA family ATPase [Thermus filiformis]KGQ22269.1 hypothetical protein THFILI_02545 [Thermus filiformis]
MRDGVQTSASYRTHVRVILTALTARVPLYIEGAPGGGKTATVEAVARWLKRPLVTVIGATRDRTDFGGWPRYSPEEDRVKLYPFPWVQELVEAGERGILFIDEMNSNEDIFPVLLRVLAERYIGDIRFHGDILAAGNPEELSVAGLLLPPPVANRVIHYSWEVSPREWAQGMRQGFERFYQDLPPPPPRESLEAQIQKAKTLVASYIERNPTALHRFPQDRLHGPWPSPRSWELLARFLGAAWALGFDEEVQAAGAWGAVGEEGYGFMTFLRELDLPPVEELLADPHRLPVREDSAYVSMMNVASHVVHNPTPWNWQQAWRVLKHAAEQRKADLAARAAQLLVEAYNNFLPEVRSSLPIPRSELSAFRELIEAIRSF